VELNKLEPRKDACRAYLVLKNGTGSAFQELKLDMVMFDADGVVGRRVAVQGAPPGVGKTSLKVFDIDGIPCPRDRPHPAQRRHGLPRCVGPARRLHRAGHDQLPRCRAADQVMEFMRKPAAVIRHGDRGRADRRGAARLQRKA
jgi:hypothetical protein